MRAYAYSRDGLNRAMIADEYNFTYEEVDRWPRERVQYYLARMDALQDERDILSDEKAAEYREQHDLEDVDQSFDGANVPSSATSRRPSNISDDEWESMPDSMKRRASTPDSDGKKSHMMIPESYREQYMNDGDADTENT